MMDPKQCLLDARAALLLRAWTAARVSVRSYYEWRNKGGFVPTLTAVDRFNYDGSPYTVNANEWAAAIMLVADRRPKNPSTEAPAFLTFQIQ